MEEYIVNSSVLVLNENYLPLNVCKVRRAIVLVLLGKAEVIENGRGYFNSAMDTFEIPSVIRLIYMVKRQTHPCRMTKLEIFNRDRYTCQYCGKETKELTLDHVIPRKNHGKHTWDNVVAACIPCNRRKAGRTPMEAGMPLLREPRAPVNMGFYISYQYIRNRVEWHKYFPHMW